MDDAFAYRTTVPFRRRVDRRRVKLGVVLAVVTVGIGVFAQWVVASERASFARADERRVGAEVTVRPVSPSIAPEATDADAREAVRVALLAARAARAEGGSFLDAGPAQLADLQPGYLFVDGPSTMPRVVSVASTDGSWAAAIKGRTCLWVRISGAGEVERGTSTVCTGASALTASPDGWTDAADEARPLRGSR
jgi:hypothetical protein